MSKSDIFLYSEPYSPTGNVTSEGVLNQLGRPKLDIFTVLVREAVQNSWDARASADGSIRFGISVWTIDQKQREGLRLFFQDVPPGLQLDQVLDEDQDVLLLSIYDRGTVGLGGPTRADQRVGGDEAYDFVDFLRNVGQPPDKKLSGGTYGYGKAAFYRASRAHTILVHTRCMWQGVMQSRFIGAALGEPYVSNERRFTGRHWWGRKNDEIAEPLLDTRADRAADFLHLPLYRDGERGTTITIVQPVFGESVEQTVYAMRDALLWYFWPKMLPNGSGMPDIDFEMTWQHQPLEIPSPEQFPPLNLFAKAMANLKTAGTGDSMFGRVIEIDSLRPKQHLGTLAMEKGLAKERSYADVEGAPIAVGERCHHIALMRQPELVVRYLPCEGLPTDSAEYAGVFVTAEDVDRVFADAEPPTHDDWVSNFLEDKRQRTFINVALSRIAESASAFVRPSVSQGQSGDAAIPLGAFANKMGQLLVGRDVRDAERPKPIQRQRQPEPIDIPVIPAPPLISPSTSVPSQFEPASRQSFDSIQSDDSALQPSGTDTLRQASPPAAQYMPSTFDIASPDEPLSPHRPRGSMQVKLHPDSEFILLDDGTPGIGFRLEVVLLGDSARVRIHASARAVLDDGSFEDDPPQGASVPHVLFWQSPTGELLQAAPFIEVDENSAGRWWVVINVIDDAELGLEIQSEQLL
jgi:hypothetical protein